MSDVKVRPPLVELTLARLREFVREPEALFWTFVFPILMAVALAVAFPGGRAAPEVLVGLVDVPAAAGARAALEASGRATVRAVEPGGEVRALREGEVHLVLEATDPVTYRFDPERQESAVARLVVDDVLKDAAGRPDPWQAQEAPVRIVGSRYVDWLIPGLVGMTIMGGSMWGIGFSIVQVRMRKLLKRLVASPMRKREYLIAQVLARLVFLAPEVAVPLLFAVLVLGLPIQGRIVDIAAVSVVGALGFGGVGLLVASRARTFEAINGLLNVFMLPMWVLSGVFFASSTFPDALQPLIRVLPLTALNDALRLVILDGETAAAAGRELATLGVWGGTAFGVALKIFNWR
jgi:ABC-type multidrug transport system permease subunit